VSGESICDTTSGAEQLVDSDFLLSRSCGGVTWKVPRQDWKLTGTFSCEGRYFTGNPDCARPRATIEVLSPMHHQFGAASRCIQDPTTDVQCSPGFADESYRVTMWKRSILVALRAYYLRTDSCRRLERAAESGTDAITGIAETTDHIFLPLEVLQLDKSEEFLRWYRAKLGWSDSATLRNAAGRLQTTLRYLSDTVTIANSGFTTVGAMMRLKREQACDAHIQTLIGEDVDRLREALGSCSAGDPALRQAVSELDTETLTATLLGQLAARGDELSLVILSSGAEAAVSIASIWSQRLVPPALLPVISFAQSVWDAGTRCTYAVPLEAQVAMYTLAHQMLTGGNTTDCDCAAVGARSLAAADAVLAESIEHGNFFDGLLGLVGGGLDTYADGLDAKCSNPLLAAGDPVCRAKQSLFGSTTPTMSPGAQVTERLTPQRSSSLAAQADQCFGAEACAPDANELREVVSGLNNGWVVDCADGMVRLEYSPGPDPLINLADLTLLALANNRLGRPEIAEAALRTIDTYYQRIADDDARLFVGSENITLANGLLILLLAEKGRTDDALVVLRGVERFIGREPGGLYRTRRAWLGRTKVGDRWVRACINSGTVILEHDARTRRECLAPGRHRGVVSSSQGEPLHFFEGNVAMALAHAKLAEITGAPEHSRRADRLVRALDRAFARRHESVQGAAEREATKLRLGSPGRGNLRPLKRIINDYVSKLTFALILARATGQHDRAIALRGELQGFLRRRLGSVSVTALCARFLPAQYCQRDAHRIMSSDLFADASLAFALAPAHSSVLGRADTGGERR
jgi:hypothetical protein